MTKSGVTKSTETWNSQLRSACRDASRERLIASTSGNFSVRLEREAFSITRSGVQLGSVELDDFVEVDHPLVVTQEAVTRDKERASIEAPMHAAIYRVRDDVRSVLHCQSPYATTLACRDEPDVDLNLIPEFPAYVRAFASVDFHLPGSDELADAVAAAFENSDVRVVQLRNHGQLVVGDSPAQVVQRATFFELACRVWISSNGQGLRTISADHIRALRNYG